MPPYLYICIYIVLFSIYSFSHSFISLHARNMSVRGCRCMHLQQMNACIIDTYVSILHISICKYIYIYIHMYTTLHISLCIYTHMHIYAYVCLNFTTRSRPAHSKSLLRAAKAKRNETGRGREAANAKARKRLDVPKYGFQSPPRTSNSP